MPASEFPNAFPPNPGFMYGARQALCLAEVLASGLQGAAIQPTDVSTSHGLALDLFSNRSPGGNQR